MRFLLVVSLAAGCWTSSKPAPAEPAAEVAESPRPAPVEVREVRPTGPQPIIVRVLNFAVHNNVITVGVGGGANRGIEDTWRAEILDGQTELPLAGGELEIVKVDATVTVTKTGLTVDQIKQNTRVRLSPP